MTRFFVLGNQPYFLFLTLKKWITLIRLEPIQGKIIGYCFGFIRARHTSSEVLLRLIPGDAIFLLIPQYNKAFLSLYLRHTHDLASLSEYIDVSPPSPRLHNRFSLPRPVARARHIQSILFAFAGSWLNGVTWLFSKTKNLPGSRTDTNALYGNIYSDLSIAKVNLKNSQRDSVKNYTDIGAEWNCTMISRNVYQHIFGS